MDVLWKTGTRAKVSAELAYDVIEQICGGDRASMTAEKLVEHSEPEDAPLHECFEWDDSVAGEKYRMEQARYVLRCLVMVNAYEGQTEPIRVYDVVEEPPPLEVADAQHKERPHRYYRRTLDIMADPEARAQLVQRALREAAAFRRKYAELTELASLFDDIDRHTGGAA